MGTRRDEDGEEVKYRNGDEERCGREEGNMTDQVTTREASPSLQSFPLYIFRRNGN